MHSEWSGVMLVNFESSEVYVNRKTCTGFPQIGGKYESQLIDLDFPGLEEDFHICTTKYKKNFVCWFLSAFLCSDAQEKNKYELKKKTALRQPDHSLAINADAGRGRDFEDLRRKVASVGRVCMPTSAVRLRLLSWVRKLPSLYFLKGNYFAEVQ